MADLNQILGLGKFQPINKICCFLPFIGEFGWYVMTYVKRFNAFNHNNKIVCCKRGHECLFPTASGFYYDWQDIDDSGKAGIISNSAEDVIKSNFSKLHDDVYFISPSEMSWDEKTTLAPYGFTPKPKNSHSFIVDIVIAPRNRIIDAQRNWTFDKWQAVVDAIVAKGITVAVCGTKSTSFDLSNVKYKSWDYIDVDTDVELMNTAKLIIVQESGLAYLSYLCKRPTILMDHPHEIGALHRDSAVFYQNVNAWHDPQILINRIVKYMDGQ